VIGRLVDNYIYERLEKDLKLRRIPIPVCIVALKFDFIVRLFHLLSPQQNQLNQLDSFLPVMI
jgi:hypothetical protein